ncbi:MAG: DUF4118 domain-containing protein [Nocardioidaceae bacterium]
MTIAADREGADFVGTRRLPASAGVSTRRRWVATALAIVVLPVLTLGLVVTRDDSSLGTGLVLYLLVVVVVAVVGGVLPAVGSSVAAFLLANWFLTPPYHTFDIERRDSLVALVVFVAVAGIVSVTVEIGARRRAGAVRAQLAADVLAQFTAAPLDETSLTAVLTRVRDLFGLSSVALVSLPGNPAGREDGADRAVVGTVLARVGDPRPGDAALAVQASPDLRLEATGPEVFAEDRGLLRRLAETAARAYEGERLGAEAARSAQLAEVDRLRSALLAAVGHDLRTPLAGVKAAVTSLRQSDVTWSTEQQAELLATIETSADRLADLISNLLAMSRLQAGALSVALEPTVLDEVVSRALLHTTSERLEIEVADDLPPLRADAGLLERVVVNLVDNARRFSPPSTAVRLVSGYDGDSVWLQVIDHGVGVPAERWEEMFLAFQRLRVGVPDASSVTGTSEEFDPGTGGVGLGLTIARGFVLAMGGSLAPSETPGGGLTMTIRLVPA